MALVNEALYSAKFVADRGSGETSSRTISGINIAGQEAGTGAAVDTVMGYLNSWMVNLSTATIGNWRFIEERGWTQ